MTESLRRLPYSNVTAEPSRAASTEPAMDSTGVIPLPAAISTCCPGTSRSGVNAPDGACTSTTSPGRTWCTSQPDTAPPATSRTPIRGARPLTAQME